MKKLFSFILFSIISIVGLSQTDSLQIISFNLSECINGNGCERESSYRITNSKFKSDTLIIDIKGYANCAGTHNAQITRIKNEIFITFEDGKGIDLSSADTSSFFIDKTTKDTSYLVIFDEDTPVDCDFFYDFNFKIIGLDTNQSYHYYINDKFVLNYWEYDSLRICVLIDKLKKSKPIIKKYSDLSIKNKYSQKMNVKYSFVNVGYSPEESYYSIAFYEKELSDDSILFKFKLYKYQNYRVVFYDSKKKKEINLTDWVNQ